MKKISLSFINTRASILNVGVPIVTRTSVKKCIAKNLFQFVALILIFLTSSCVSVYKERDDADCYNNSCTKCMSGCISLHGNRIYMGSYRSELGIHPVGGFFIYDIILDPFLTAGTLVTDTITLRFLWDHKCQLFAGATNLFLSTLSLLPFYHHKSHAASREVACIILVVITGGAGAYFAPVMADGYWSEEALADGEELAEKIYHLQRGNSYGYNSGASGGIGDYNLEEPGITEGTGQGGKTLYMILVKQDGDWKFNGASYNRNEMVAEQRRHSQLGWQTRIVECWVSEASRQAVEKCIDKYPPFTP